jgi:hypothetical protein
MYSCKILYLIVHIIISREVSCNRFNILIALIVLTLIMYGKALTRKDWLNTEHDLEKHEHSKKYSQRLTTFYLSFCFYLNTLCFPDPPEIELETDRVHSGENKEAHLTCLIHGNPTPTVSNQCNLIKCRFYFLHLRKIDKCQ